MAIESALGGRTLLQFGRIGWLVRLVSSSNDENQTATARNTDRNRLEPTLKGTAFHWTMPPCWVMILS